MARAVRTGVLGTPHCLTGRGGCWKVASLGDDDCQGHAVLIA